MAHLLTHFHSLIYSLTYLLKKDGGKTIIIVVCPKQKIVVFINFYNFNFVVFVNLALPKQPLQRCSYDKVFRNMQQISRRAPMLNCDFEKAAMHGHSPVNLLHIFQNTFSWEHLWRTASNTTKETVKICHWITQVFLFLHHIQSLHAEHISGLLQQEDITLLDLLRWSDSFF